MLGPIFRTLILAAGLIAACKVNAQVSASLIDAEPASLVELKSDDPGRWVPGSIFTGADPLQHVLAVEVVEDFHGSGKQAVVQRRKGQDYWTAAYTLSFGEQTS